MLWLLKVVVITRKISNQRRKRRYCSQDRLEKLAMTLIKFYFVLWDDTQPKYYPSLTEQEEAAYKTLSLFITERLLDGCLCSCIFSVTSFICFFILPDSSPSSSGHSTVVLGHKGWPCTRRPRSGLQVLTSTMKSHTPSHMLTQWRNVWGREGGGLDLWTGTKVTRTRQQIPTQHQGTWPLTPGHRKHNRHFATIVHDTQ